MSRTTLANIGSSTILAVDMHTVEPNLTARYVEALTANADDVPIRGGPVLAGTAVAGHADDSSAVERIATLYVHAAAAHAGDLTILDVPLLPRATDAGNEAHGGAVNRISMPGKIGALIIGIVDDFARAGRQQNCEGRGGPPERFFHDWRSE
jgi:hypothetical protein